MTNRPDPVSVPVARSHGGHDLCAVPPSPQLRDRIRETLASAREGAGSLVAPGLRYVESTAVGLNDGLILPGTMFPVGTTADVARSAALERAPLRGTVRVIVVLVDFSDKPMTQTADHFRDLFFSTGVLPKGSVKEYFTEASHGLVTIGGEVVGPYRMPQPLSYYAGSQSGLQGTRPNARDLANDAAVAADPAVNFAPYDNDGNGFVDAFVVVHAGPGAEVTGSTGDIWSHKWVLPSAYAADGSQIYAYLTIPEDAKIGVSCHELGHLLFGWPDLYDTDYSSEGIGNWCLMAGGSWNGGGDVPAHPSAWCKVNQGWASVTNQTTNTTVTIADVKSSYAVLRLWKNGGAGNEYFLVENRQRTGFDANLPGDGLLIWHVDDAVATNANENHPKVALMQADGRRDLENDANRGDAGDPYPGSAGNTSFTASSTPNSKSYAGADTCVAVTSVSASAASMTARVAVRCLKGGPLGKEIIKDVKEYRKDLKEIRKEVKERIKDVRKETKEIIKDVRDGKGPRKDIDKPITDKATRLDKGFSDKWREGRPWDRPFDRPGGTGRAEGAAGEEVAELRARVDQLEELLAALLAEAGGGAGGGPGGAAGEAATPFIGAEERPDLSASALAEEDDLADVRAAMESGSAQAKRLYDSAPPQ